MTRTLYLHIGSHKTGTTSIQHFLAGKTAELAARGYAYPVTDKGVNLGTLLGGLGGDQDVADAEAGAGKLDKKTRLAIQMLSSLKEPNVIASSEGFSYVNDPERLRHFQKRLSQSFDRILVITYLRRQDQFAISHHQEGANPQAKPAGRMHGHRPTALPETSELQRQYLDYDARIGLWADIFGDENMVIRLYDRALLKNGDSVADFLDIVGLGDMDPTMASPRNVSMGFVKSKMGHLLHQVLPDQATRGAVLSRLPDEGRLLPRRDDARRFVAPYVESNRRLNARFNLSPNPDLFPDDFSMYPEDGQEDWTEDTADAAIRACLEMIKSLTAGNFAFDTNDYAAAGRALEDSEPALALRFLVAAQALRPTGIRLRARIEKLCATHGLALPAPPEPDPEVDDAAAEQPAGSRHAATEPPADAEPVARKGRRGRRAKAAAEGAEAAPDQPVAARQAATEPPADAEPVARKGRRGRRAKAAAEAAPDQPVAARRAAAEPEADAEPVARKGRRGRRAKAAAEPAENAAGGPKRRRKAKRLTA